MFSKRPLIGDLQFPPPLNLRVLCVKEPEGDAWTKGLLSKDIILPLPGRFYTVRSSVRGSDQFILPTKTGILLAEITNKLVEVRKGLIIEPFFPCSCFTAYGSRP